MNDLTDSELVARAAAGDGVAFEVLMRRHNQLVFRTIRSMIPNDADAEDAAQEAWLSAWRALGKFRSESRFSTWLVRIAANEALGRLRRKNPETVPLEEELSDITTEAQSYSSQDSSSTDAEQAMVQLELRKRLERDIDALPEAFRAVFMLRAVEEMSVEEVSSVLGIPAATVRSRFFRARGLLRERLPREAETEWRAAFAFDGARCDRIVAGVLARARQEGLLNNTVHRDDARR